MTVSVIAGHQIGTLESLLPYADLCRERDLRLWTGQSMMIETNAALAALAGRGYHLDVGTSVAVAPLRTPVDAALQARSLSLLSGRRVSAGYGMGTAAMAARIRGSELRAPATWTAAYVAEVRRALGPVSVVPLHPVDGDPDVELGCGVLRPRMAHLAGGVADFAVTWLAPLPYIVDQILPALARGAAAAGRQCPRLVSILHCAVAGEDRNPVRLAAVGCGMHLQQPHYVDMFRKAGYELVGSLAPDLRTAVKSGLFIYGTVWDVVDEIRRYWDAGADEVVLNTGAVAIEHGEPAAVADLKRIFDALDHSYRERPRHRKNWTAIVRSADRATRL